MLSLRDTAPDLDPTDRGDGGNGGIIRSPISRHRPTRQGPWGRAALAARTAVLQRATSGKTEVIPGADKQLPLSPRLVVIGNLPPVFAGSNWAADHCAGCRAGWRIPSQLLLEDCMFCEAVWE